VAQWTAITKSPTWCGVYDSDPADNSLIPATYVQCTDGTVAI
jgi:hypothetical protein